MKLRGKNFKTIDIIDIVAISSIQEEAEVLSFSDAIENFLQDIKVDPALFIKNNRKMSSNQKRNNIIHEIRQGILRLYGNEITNWCLIHYVFFSSYRRFCLKIDGFAKNYPIEKIQELLVKRYSRGISFEEIKKCKGETNKAVTTLENCIDIEWLKFFCSVNKHLLKQYQLTETSIQIFNILLQNSLQLGLIKIKPIKVDEEYYQEWRYYPVNKLFQECEERLKNDLKQENYQIVKAMEHELFQSMLNSQFHFDSIRQVTIKKNEKTRNMLMIKDPAEKVVSFYLSQRIKTEYSISFPNREDIMNLCFNIIDSLPKLEDFTIYRFDFKDFFESIDGREIYNKYIQNSSLKSFERKLIKELVYNQKYGCRQGLPTSNVLVEVASNDFDHKLQNEFYDKGLILYRRYVDDGILIFNRYISQDVIDKGIKIALKDVFDGKVMLSEEKTKYLTRNKGCPCLEYLGYSFQRKQTGSNVSFLYGISAEKIEKYKKQLEGIYKDYLANRNKKLLHARLEAYESRIVFCNYMNGKFSHKGTWSVYGIISTYKLLRPYIIYEQNVQRRKIIQEDTRAFLMDYHKDLFHSFYDQHGIEIPDYLKGKGINNYNLWHGFLYNKSIVFHPNIGWSSEYLCNRLKEIYERRFDYNYKEMARLYYGILNSINMK